MYDEATVFLIEDSTENLDDKLVKLEFSEPGGELSKELAKKKKKKKNCLTVGEFHKRRVKTQLF